MYPQAANSAFSSRMREARRAQKLTQADLATKVSELIGAAFYTSAVTRIEKNDRVIRLEEAVAIAQVLGVSLTWLIQSGDSPEEQLANLERDLSAAREAESHARASLKRAQDEVTLLETKLQNLKTRHQESSAQEM